MNKRIEKILKNPSVAFLSLGYRGVFNWMSDEQYLKIAYWCKVHKRLNLNCPETFNEKTQWLKLNNRHPKYTMMVDKYAVKQWVAECIGAEYVIPTLGVWDKFEQIDFNALPSQFVLKCTHDSGSIVICRDKSTLDKAHARRILNKGLGHNSFWGGREWPYKNVKPRIIAEKYMQEPDGSGIKDYKVFVFNGKARCIQVDYDRFTNHRRNFYDTDWTYIPFTTCYPTDIRHEIERPPCLGELLSKAEALVSCADTPPFLRTDFYIINNKLYFGELTFYHGGGMEIFYPGEWDVILGSWMCLPEFP